MPGGALFELDSSGGRPYYLHHRSELGEFWLSSDAVIPTVRYLPVIWAQVTEAEAHLRELGLGPSPMPASQGGLTTRFSPGRPTP